MKLRACLTFVALIGISCKTSQPASEARDNVTPANAKFDIIDSSFLLPFPSQKFSIKASGDRVAIPGGEIASVLMSPDQFKRLPKEFHDHLGTGKTWEQMLDRLYITGFRYDPCFPIVPKDLNPNGAGCRVRAIRLVGQFIDMAQGVASAGTMHILFIMKSPDPAQDFAVNDGMIRALKDLRAAAGVPTAGVPLGIHPGFMGPNAEMFAQKVKGLILKFAGVKNFFATSVFFQSPQPNTDGETIWNWAQFLMKPSGTNPAERHLVLEPTTGVKPGVTMDFGKFLLAPDGAARTDPATDKLRDVQDPTNPIFFPIPDISGILQDRATPADLGKGVAAADFFENAGMMTISAGDCASCHAATQRKLTALDAIGGAADRRFMQQKFPGITGEMDPRILETMRTKADGNPRNTIVINFGYKERTPVISQRTLNEAVHITRLINEKMWDGGWQAVPPVAPGPSAPTP